jgi:1-acyl-sn-glycerol-3-phosphate acyltransferase
MTLRKFVVPVIRLLFRLLTRLEVCGCEQIPVQDGLILAINHLSRLDAPLVYILVPRDDLTALVADKYRQNPLFRWLVDMVNGIWIHREERTSALRAARHLQAGGALGIAPEGTRSQTGKLGEAKTGVAYLADKASVPILPVGVCGTEHAIHQVLRLRRPRIHVRFGEPFRLPPVERRERDAALQRNTDEIMCRIAALLPPEYAGIYAGHQRLRELRTAGGG